VAVEHGRNADPVALFGGILTRPMDSEAQGRAGAPADVLALVFL